MPPASVRGVFHSALFMRLLPAAAITHRPLTSCSCSTLSSNLLALVTPHSSHLDCRARSCRRC
eukprot:3257689-Heterocapsa_arctica.AAC.1